MQIASHTWGYQQKQMLTSGVMLTCNVWVHADHAMKEGVDAPSDGHADVSAARLSRLFFAIGQFAIQHLVRRYCH